MSQKLDKDFWNEKYKQNQTGWDIGYPSTPLKVYIDQLDEKNLRILIPGAGNAYEAKYLLEQGFRFITILDIAPHVIEKHKELFADHPEVTLVEGDFFKHQGRYDLILEQTFFCALPPNARRRYFTKMNALLEIDGKLCGVLFNTEFEGGPPFGGSKEEYIPLTKDLFTINKMDECYNSIPPRAGKELWIDLQKA